MADTESGKIKQRENEAQQVQEELDSSQSPSPKPKVRTKNESISKDSTIGVVFSNFESSDGLSFSQGEELLILGSESVGTREFYIVRKVHEQKEGLVPKENVYLLNSKNIIEPTFDVVALYKYTSRSQEELSFDERDSITVLSTDENITKKKGFWKGKHVKEDKVGIFPCHMVYRRCELKEAPVFPYYAKALFDSKSENPEQLQFLQGDYLIILSQESEGMLKGCRIIDEKTIGLISETFIDFSTKETALNSLSNEKSKNNMDVDEKEQLSSEIDGRPRPKLKKKVSFEENTRPADKDAIKMEFPKDPEELEKTAICFQQLLQDKQKKITSLNSQIKSLEEELQLERFVISFVVIIIGLIAAYAL